MEVIFALTVHLAVYVDELIMGCTYWRDNLGTNITVLVFYMDMVVSSIIIIILINRYSSSFSKKVKKVAMNRVGVHDANEEDG